MGNKGGAFGHPLVGEASVLALSKFMCISEEFCEHHLSLLFTTLERATDTAVRRYETKYDETRRDEMR